VQLNSAIKRGSDNECLSVVMPAFNEENTIATIIERVSRIPNLREIVVVDDCSTDRTYSIISEIAKKDARVVCLKLPRNMGKTEALKIGFAATEGDIVVVQDADLEYDPSELSMVIQPILDGHADVVYGSRFLVHKTARVLYFYHYVANKCLTFACNLFTNMNMSDVETCYKAFRGDIIRNMIITSSGFGFEIEVTAKVAKLKCRVYEVPISYYGRTYEEGKKIGWRDGVAALWYIVWFSVFRSLQDSFRTIPTKASVEPARELEVAGTHR